MKIIRKNEARVFLEGPEVCREYCVSGKITFGSSTLMPGQTGAIDPGHPDSHEVFYCSRGHVLIRDPNSDKCYELFEGDILFVPETIPHEMTNIGTEVSVVTWSLAPSEK